MRQSKPSQVKSKILALAPPDLLAISDSGASNTDNLTKDNTPTLRLALDPTVKGVGSIQVVEDNKVLATVSVTPKLLKQGYVDLTRLTLADGEHRLSSRVVDQAGKILAKSDALSIVIDTMAPDASALYLAPVPMALREPPFPRQIFFQKSGAGVGDELILFGHGSQTPVNLSQENIDAGFLTVRPEIGPITGFQLTDLAGNISQHFFPLRKQSPTPSDALSDPLPGLMPQQQIPALTAPDLLASSDSGASNTDNLTKIDTPTLQVKLDSNDMLDGTIQVVEGDRILASEIVTLTLLKQGYVNLTCDNLGDGKHQLSSRFVDEAGITLAQSAALSVTIDTVPPDASTLRHEASWAQRGFQQIEWTGLAIDDASILLALTPSWSWKISFGKSGAAAGDKLIPFDLGSRKPVTLSQENIDAGYVIVDEGIRPADHPGGYQLTDLAGNTSTHPYPYRGWWPSPPSPVTDLGPVPSDTFFA